MRLELTKRCEYGIRILLELAMLPAGVKMTTAELAKACEVPPGNVPTIVNVMTRAGFLTSSPGRGGGCALAGDPEKVSLLAISRVLEGNLEIEHCLLDSRQRGCEPKCCLHDIWMAGRGAALAALEQISLADAIRWERAKSGMAEDEVG